MSIKKLVLAFFAVLVVVTALNSLMPEFMRELASSNFKGLREQPFLHFHMLAILVHSFLIAVIYPLGYRGGAPWFEGLRFGLLLALLISLPAALHQYAMLDAPISHQFLPVLWTLWVNGIAGIVVALIYGRNAYPIQDRYPRPAASQTRPMST